MQRTIRTIRKRTAPQRYDNSAALKKPKKKGKKKPPTKEPSATQDVPATHPVTDPEDQWEDQTYLENKITPLVRSIYYDNSDPSKISWRVLAMQIGLPKWWSDRRVGGTLKRALQSKMCRKKLAEWLHDPAQVAAALAANGVADMEVERLLRVPLGWHSSALKCDQVIMQAMDQKIQQEKEEIEFNVQVNKRQEQERAEKAELKRCQAEWRAEEKRRLKHAKFAELLTVDEALSFLWHNVGREVLLVALNNLGGFGKACPYAFEMVIAVLHKAMQQGSVGCSTGPGQSSTAAADMCTAINTTDVLIVHLTKRGDNARKTICT